MSWAGSNVFYLNALRKWYLSRVISQEEVPVSSGVPVYTTRLFLKEQFCMNNEAQIYPKIKNKLRTITRLGFRRTCNCKFLLKNTTHHVITCGVSLQVFLQLETLSEQRRKSKLRRTCLMTCLYWVFAVIIYMMEHEQFKKQLRLKLCKNLRATILGQNLLVLI